jgi:hypothetical protein
MRHTRAAWIGPIVIGPIVTGSSVTGEKVTSTVLLPVGPEQELDRCAGERMDLADAVLQVALVAKVD